MRILTVFLYFLILLAISVLPAKAQDLNPNRLLAKVGGYNIYESEFIERYEFNPMFRKQLTKQTANNKLEFLYTLIAEKIWTQYALEQRYDTTLAVKTAIESIEKMMVRDALFRQEIKSKVKITNELLLEGIERYSKKYNTRFVVSKDSIEIFNIYNLIKTGISFDSILVSRKEFTEQPNQIAISFGDMQKGVEDEIYKQSTGGFTIPLNYPDGWYIFYVYNITEQKLGSGEIYETAIKNIEKIIRDRITEKLYSEYYYNFFKNKSVDADAKLFNAFAKKIIKIFNYKKQRSQNDSTDAFSLEANDILKIESELRDTINFTFIKLNDKKISLRNFLRELALQGFYLNQINNKNIYTTLNNSVRQFIEYELLAQEGYKQELHFNPDVINSVQIWKDNYLFHSIRSSIIEKTDMSDSTVYQYYLNTFKEKKQPKLVNIVEVLTDSLEKANFILQEISKGKDIYELAEKYSKRTWTKNKRGEFGLFPITSYGEIGRIASKMNVGDYFGPLKLKDGYSIFKLIDSKNDTLIKPSKSYDEISEKLKRDLALQLKYNQIISKTAELADKYQIYIDPQVLNTIEVTTINSFGIRYIGFGGKISAVPMLAPETEWVDIWLKRKKDLP